MITQNCEALKKSGIQLKMEADKGLQKIDSSEISTTRPDIFYKVDIVVIGAGQAGLSAAYHLKREGIEPGRGFVILDDEFSAGGAWQHRWDSLTLSNVNGIHDLPGLGFSDAINTKDTELQANVAIPTYYEE